MNNKQKKLIQAIKLNDVTQVEQLVSGKIDLNYRDKQGFTPLLKAAQGGNAEITKLLVKGGSDKRAVTPHGYCILCVVAIEGNFDLFTMLVDLGFDVKESCGDWNVIVCAAVGGNVEIVNYIMENGEDVNSLGAYTAAKMAVQHKKLKVLKYLVKHGLDINDVKGEQSILAEISANGAAQTINEILDLGADPNLISSGGYPLHNAAAWGNNAAVRVLLDRGAEPQVADDEGNTPAFYAAEQGHIKIVKMLQGHNT